MLKYVLVMTQLLTNRFPSRFTSLLKNPRFMVNFLLVKVGRGARVGESTGGREGG